MAPWRLLVAMAAVCIGAAPADAHEVRPAYLELREAGPNAYLMTWKQPVSGEARLVLRPRLPPDCFVTGATTIEPAPASVIERSRITCSESLEGRRIHIAGLERTMTSVYVRTQWRSGEESAALANPSTPDIVLGAGPAPALARYVGLGVEHILGGYDHLAFVAGLVLLVTGVRRLVLALTAFTVAHSLTLGAAALGKVGLPSWPVETAIALSIVLVGYEAVRLARGQTGWSVTYPWLVAFGFGLLHGFGFAGALADIGLPDSARIAALLLFNIGVEIGQLICVAVLLTALALARRFGAQPATARLVGGYGVGITGAFWLVQRLAGLASQG